MYQYTLINIVNTLDSYIKSLIRKDIVTCFVHTRIVSICVNYCCGKV